jgi:hypothetical protein
LWLHALSLTPLLFNHLLTNLQECGFGPGEKGYAHLQCVMAEFETDPLIGQYAGAAMARLWEAAGLDQSTIQSAGNIRLPGGPGTS